MNLKNRVKALEKSKEPIRVLQINSGDREFGGVSSFLYNVYSIIDTDKVQFDFLSPHHTTYSTHAKEIRERGAKIYELEVSWDGILAKLKYCDALRRFLSNHHYNIVHINSGNFIFCFLTLVVLKRLRIKYRIVHSHSVDTGSSVLKSFVIKTLKKRLTINATACFAPSIEAADFMFDCTVKEPIILKDGVFVDRYGYDESVRSAVRKEIGVDGKFVVGHVGRFEIPKNHEFLLKSLSLFLKKNDDAVLCLIGSGSLEKKIRDLASALNIDDRVVFLGERKDISRLYQGMDCFVFPSLYEGLGMALVEAQIAGLPCLISDRIPKATTISDRVITLPIGDDSTIQWVKMVHYIKENPVDRRSYDKEAVANGYSVYDVASYLLKYYLKCK